MKIFPAKYPAVFRRLYPNRLSLQKASKTLFLTFDDGPVPGITSFVLDQLDAYKAKATFFCIGENVKKYPEIFGETLSRGHRIGNHTHNHLNGWKTPTSTYIDNTLLTENEIKKEESKKNTCLPCNDHEPHTTNQLKLFRPPFGKIKNSQARELVKRGYSIVMWDVLSWDFRNNIGKEKCLQNVINNSEEGSIIVFHDSLKAAKNLKAVLPEILDYYNKKGFQFKSL